MTPEEEKRWDEIWERRKAAEARREEENAKRRMGAPDRRARGSVAAAKEELARRIAERARARR